MQKSFVKEICDVITKNHGPQELKNVLLVIPSQRIGLHIKKEFSDTMDNVLWLPEIKTIDNFIESLSANVTIDSLNAVFELYLSYVKVFENPDSFDTFLTWGKQILNDFGEVDKYLLESKDVFKNLQSIKEIEAWSFNADELTETQKKFLVFWEYLGKLYTQFNHDLNAQGLCTKSSLYKEIANNPISYLSSLKYDKIYFVGFNALSTSEERIFSFLIKSEQAQAIWDADGYYINDKEQEAGTFIRKNIKWSNFDKTLLKNDIVNSPKQIFLYGANSNINQTLIASSILGEDEKFNTKKSALIFSDENLLRPMLDVLPNNIERMNVAMGYPLNASNAYSLLSQIFTTLKNVERYRQKKSLYYKDFLQIFQHELIQLMLKEKGIDIQGLINKINKENYTYLPKSIVEEELGGGMEFFNFLFFDQQMQVVDLIQYVRLLFIEIRNILLKGDKDLIELEALTVIVANIDKLILVLQKHPFVTSSESLLLLIKQLIRTESISFYGEPLQGLQVLGLLETRGLDFENVILLSCNEEILPAASFSQSLMPYDLRKYFGLPSKDDKEAMFAYYFYRLFQKSSNIHLIYNDGAPDGMSSNEVSRYILQLQNELGSDVVKINEVPVQVQSDSLSLNSFAEMVDSESLRNRIFSFLDQGLSASAINTFIKCPRDFFFTYLLRPNEVETIEENIESSTYGTIVHVVLERLYQKAGKLITVEKILNMQQSIEDELTAAFKEQFPSENFTSGKNLLQFETAKYSITQFLKSEIEFIKVHGVIEIIGLEKPLEKEVLCKTPFGELKVRIKGNIDRLDKVGGVVRIIDYKTGKVTDALTLKPKVSEMYSYATQLLVYLFLYNGEEHGGKVTSGILSLKDIKSGVQVLRRDKKDEEGVQEISDELIEQFTSFINDFVNDLLSSTYEHNSSNKYCRFC